MSETSAMFIFIFLAMCIAFFIGIKLGQAWICYSLADAVIHSDREKVQSWARSYLEPTLTALKFKGTCALVINITTEHKDGVD